MRVLLISCLFILLASRLKLDDLTRLGFPGLAFLVVMLLVVRPVMVFCRRSGPSCNSANCFWPGWRRVVAASVSSVFALKLAADSGLSPDYGIGRTDRSGDVYGHRGNSLCTACWPAPGQLAWAGGSNPRACCLPAVPVRMIASALAKEVPVLWSTQTARLAAARMEGLPTLWASILSEYARGELELGGIGRLLAMTLTTRSMRHGLPGFVDYFGRAGVYQLPTKPGGADRREPVSTHRLGRLLFAVDLTYGRLAERFARGATVKTTPLTAEFDYGAFRQRYQDTAIVLFVVDENRKLTIATVDAPPSPRPGQKLISLMTGPVRPANGKSG